MAQFASALFAAADGTTLATADANFSLHPSYTGTAQIAANRVRANSTTNSAYIHSGVPASADYSVSCDQWMTEADGGGNGINVAVCARMDAAANTLYMARYLGGTTDAWQLYKIVAGTATLLGSSAAATLAATAYALKLEVIGSAIKVYVSGGTTAVISVTDTAVTAAGKAGIRSNSSVAPTDLIGVHLDNFSADDVGGATIIEADASSVGTSTTSGVSGATAGSDGASAGIATASGVAAAVALSDASSAGASTVSGDSGTVVAAVASSAGSSTASGISGATAGAVGTASGQATANGVGDGGAIVEVVSTLGGGIKRKREEKKQYLVDGVLRTLSDAEVAQIMSQPSTPEKPAKKIVLEDKPVDKPLTKGLKEWKIEPEVVKPVKTKKPVFAKETLKVEDERVIVKLVADIVTNVADDTDEEDQIIEHLLAREMKRREILSKSLTQLYSHLTGGRSGLLPGGGR